MIHSSLLKYQGIPLNREALKCLNIMPETYGQHQIRDDSIVCTNTGNFPASRNIQETLDRILRKCADLSGRLSLINMEPWEVDDLKEIAKLGFEKLKELLYGREDIFNVPDWKKGSLYILDPLFLFYLRWGGSGEGDRPIPGSDGRLGASSASMGNGCRLPPAPWKAALSNRRCT